MPAKKIQQRKFPSILTVQQFRCLYTHPKALKYCNNVIYNGFSTDHPILISKSRPSLVDLRPKLPPAVLARCVMFFWLCYSLGKAMCHGNLGRKVWRFSWHNLSYLKFSLFLLRNRSLPSTSSGQWKKPFRSFTNLIGQTVGEDRGREILPILLYPWEGIKKSESFADVINGCSPTAAVADR